MTEAELDAQIRSLPPSFGIRHFNKGISSLKAMARILLGCLVGRLPVKGIRAVALFWILFISPNIPLTTTAPWPVSATPSRVWHENHDFFITATVREDFNIPKFHSLLHYVDSIQYFGTTDNYNTEMFERLHIDFAKNGWRASNRRDEFPQIITWLGRQEKISLFAAYQEWLESTRRLPQPPVAIRLAKRPQSPRLPLGQIKLRHHTNSFIHTLKDFLNNLDPIATRMPANRLRDAVLPFTNLDVYHNFKFEPCTLDPGTRAGRVKVLFQLPQKFDDNTPVPTNWPTSCLAYVEWYSSFSLRHDDNHTMYSVSTVPLRANGFANASITCQLFLNLAEQMLTGIGRQTPFWIKVQLSILIIGGACMHTSQFGK
ncbi:hypothetical protein B0H14DRAFT_3115481 [Mycena olivaceomarginata]|nr:hypothetical protein B0H14DRAFT_3115481 [Mycena olivaceomarginata]